MKKIIFFLTPALLGFVSSYSQCVFAIPSNAIIIDSTTTLGMVNNVYWVCSGDTLNGSGVHNTYFVESGGALDMSGTEKTVYLKSGASINCSGIDDTIYYETGAIISCSGNHVDKFCSQIIFDYTNAPQGGCLTTGLSGNSVTDSKVGFSPNPFSDETTVSFVSGRNQRGRILIYGLAGNLIKEFAEYSFVRGENRLLLSMSELQNGMYLAEIQLQEKIAKIKLVKKG